MNISTNPLGDIPYRPGSECRNDERIQRPECRTGLTLILTLTLNSNSTNPTLTLIPTNPNRSDTNPSCS